MKLKTLLSVAGSDSSGGAGIQADLKTALANGVFGMTAVTVLTAQNTRGVTALSPVTPDFLEAQLAAVYDDIPPDAVKVGMVGSSDLICRLADFLERRCSGHLVVDPVMVATSGARLIDEAAVSSLAVRLFPLAEVITPNVPEAELLTEQPLHDAASMERAAELLAERWGCAVLLKGGHALEDANDVLCSSEGLEWFKGRRIDEKNTHGTGCTLSTALAANLAKGFSLRESIGRAKDYLSRCLEAGLDLGAGAGPMHHGFALPSIWGSEKND